MWPQRYDKGLDGMFVRAWVRGLSGGYRWRLYLPGTTLDGLVMGDTQAEAMEALGELNRRRGLDGLPKVYAARFLGLDPTAVSRPDACKCGNAICASTPGHCGAYMGR